MVIRRLLRTWRLGLLCWGLVGIGAAASAQTPFVRGDCNGDGDRGAVCDISDAIFALNYLFLSGEVPGCFEACNANDDSNFNIADPIYQLGACFGFGNRIPPPFPECGRDPTPSLSCDEYRPCEVDCAPQDARGVGACLAIVGIFWDGSQCRTHSGCECEGTDCKEGFASIAACQAAFEPCPAECGAQDADAVGECATIIGIWWDGEACRAESGCECAGADCDALFGTMEECIETHLDCGPANCRPQDAQGIGPCDAVLGIFWDGHECREHSGCTCEGADCGDGYSSFQECYLVHRGCESICDPMDVAGVGLCRLLLGWYWDGLSCQSLGGCECAGSDCPELYPSANDCERAHRGCPGLDPGGG